MVTVHVQIGEWQCKGCVERQELTETEAETDDSQKMSGGDDMPFNQILTIFRQKINQ